MRFGALGSPDIICVIKGQFVGIEVKRPGGKQSDSQAEVQARLEEAGGQYILAFDLDDVVKAIAKLTLLKQFPNMQRL